MTASRRKTEEQDSPPYWAVCRTFSTRVPWVRVEIEKVNHGTFFPTYARMWNSDGKLSAREKALMPGYLFFMTTEEGWGDVANVEGVYRVLAQGGKASRVRDDEMWRLVLGHASGAHNEINLTGLPTEPKRRHRRRRRRPRHGKRARGGADERV